MVTGVSATDINIMDTSRKLPRRCALFQMSDPTLDQKVRESEGKNSCVNCGQEHTANYRGCPKAPEFVTKIGQTTKGLRICPRHLPGSWKTSPPSRQAAQAAPQL
ncbi:hypothetical protein EVAR_98748_1 [Eumeta japonica]|uniref:Nucleic-acid-binding protein from transposon X-element n=1 Tax=Eumeta variegata TaxID=151549 RepID=A0A4C1YTX3_EUMVA|nr:hypothetical protein EVAR_98748_1 [Eumeta japonica]